MSLNCLEFRRQLGVDPHVSGDFAQHRHECNRCADAHARAIAFEKAVRGALHISVPEKLAESVLLAQATNAQRRHRRFRRRATWTAAAAGIVLAFGIGLRLQAKPLPELAINHLKKEAFVLGKTQPISDDLIRKAFDTFGVTMGDIPAGASFVACCPVGKYVSVHLVVPENEGPVTLLYLVDDHSEQRQDFIKDGWFGRAVPLAHGTLVLIGRDAAHFDQLETSWRNALQTATYKT
jgi:hypothetical protein